MNTGVRRGEVPDEEIEWLECHVYCDSIRQLFEDYSEKFGSPYSTIDSFRKILHRYEIYPITQAPGYDNLNHFLELMMGGSVRWDFISEDRRMGKTGEPHWLWRWHTYSKRTPSGVSFRPYPKRLEEKQFEILDSRDPHQSSEPQRIYRGLPNELPQGQQDEARCAESSGDLYQPSSEDAKACKDRLSLDGEEQQA